MRALNRIVVLLLISLLSAILPLHAQQNDFLQATTPMPVGRAFHGTAVLGDFIYTFGGSGQVGTVTQAKLRSSYVAKILPDGQLTRWVETVPMPVAAHYISNSTIVLNDTVYVLGGSTEVVEGERISTIAWSRPLSNGLLDRWNVSEPFDATGLSCIAAFSTPGFLHVAGGLAKDGTVSDRVWSIPVRADGSLGSWQESPSLPAPLWFHSAAVVAGKVYVWGGLHEDPAVTKRPSNPSKKIYSAKIKGNGLLGAWREESVTLPVGAYSGVPAVAGPYLFYMCPRYQGGQESNDIWWTLISPEGVGEWFRQRTGLPNKMYRAAATDYRRGMIYIHGGKPALSSAPRPEVFSIRLSSEARRLAEDAWLAMNLTQSQQGGSQGSTHIASGSNYGTLSFSTEEGYGSSQLLPGFYPLNTAQGISSSQRKPLVLYFSSPTAQPCLVQGEHIKRGMVEGFTDDLVFASVDAGKNPQVIQQYGVFRVPTWIFYNSQGEEKARNVGVLTEQEMSSVVNLLN